VTLVLTSLPRLTSRRHPLVQACRDARAGGDDQPLLLDGWHLLEEGVAAGLTVDVVAVGAEPREASHADALRALVDAGAHVVAVTADVLQAMSPVRTPSGVVALARRPIIEVESTLGPRPALVVVAVDLQDPGNIGALVRTTEALGGTGVVVAGASADALGWKALRASMGSAFRLPVARAADPSAVVADLRDRGVQIVALMASGGRPADDIDLGRDTALCLGGEGPGLRSDLAAMADVSLTLPISPRVESLNVTVAGALALYEAAGQRRRGR
jgi:RNA methyltransferase, TrmH family